MNNDGRKARTEDTVGTEWQAKVRPRAPNLMNTRSILLVLSRLQKLRF